MTLQQLRSTADSAAVPEDVPVHGVGHSNGSLMHLFINSMRPDSTASNVLMSYNNKEVADAIPIPGVQRLSCCRAVCRCLPKHAAQLCVHAGLRNHGQPHAKHDSASTARPLHTTAPCMSTKMTHQAAVSAGFVERARPLLQRARERGLAQSPAQVRGFVAAQLSWLPDGLTREDVEPLLSQLSSCLREVRGSVVAVRHCAAAAECATGGAPTWAKQAAAGHGDPGPRGMPEHVCMSCCFGSKALLRCRSRTASQTSRRRRQSRARSLHPLTRCRRHCCCASRTMALMTQSRFCQS